MNEMRKPVPWTATEVRAMAMELILSVWPALMEAAIRLAP